MRWLPVARSVRTGRPATPPRRAWAAWLFAVIGLLGGCAAARPLVRSPSGATLGPMRHQIARRDPGLRATVLTRVPLRYERGADPTEDLPGHVRAGSALAWLGQRLVVVQDDTLALGLLDPSQARVDAVLLPRGEGGRRQFGSDLGNKKHKLDLEASLSLADAGGERVLALGSGSTPARERIVSARPSPGGSLAVDVIDAARLYAALRGRSEFAGSELNIEGAARVGDRVRLFQRGNGAPRGSLRPVDATADLDLAALVAFLADPTSAPVPALTDVTTYDLGLVGGARLSFTDAATAADGHVVYLAAAESSADTYNDGPVAGVALGVLGDDGPRWCPIVEADGSLLAAKVEGLAADPADPSRWYVVTDRDDPHAPSELLTLRVEGR